jgi:hypothetical protein
MNPPEHDPPTESPTAPEIAIETWQTLDGLWKSILGLEANIDGARLGMGGLRSEMESAFKKTLGLEEKLHASQADVLAWNQAKNRIHYALPKAKEFVHRATWALTVPERKRLEEVVRTHVDPRIPFADVDKVREEMEHLQKARQVLFAQGNSVNQECRGILNEVQRALSTLQRNATNNARKKKESKR